MTDTQTATTETAPDPDGWATVANALAAAVGRDSVWIDQNGDITGNPGDLARIAIRALPQPVKPSDIADADVQRYAQFIAGHPDATVDARHLAATRAVLDGLAQDGRLRENAETTA